MSLIDKRNSYTVRNSSSLLLLSASTWKPYRWQSSKCLTVKSSEDFSTIKHKNAFYCLSVLEAITLNSD